MKQDFSYLDWIALVPTNHPELSDTRLAWIEALKSATGPESVMSDGTPSTMLWPEFLKEAPSCFALERIEIKPDGGHVEDDFDALSQWLDENPETQAASSNVPWLALGRTDLSSHAYALLWDGEQQHYISFRLNKDLPRTRHSLLAQWLDFDNCDHVTEALTRCLKRVTTAYRAENLEAALPLAEDEPVRGRNFRF